MITVMNDLPPHVAGFTATGDVTADDYNKAVIPVIDAVAAKSARINFLLELRTTVSHYHFGAWAKDIFVGIKYLTKWDRMAIVSDEHMVTDLSNKLGFLLPGTVKGFKLEELAQAKAWVSGKD